MCGIISQGTGYQKGSHFSFSACLLKNGGHSLGHRAQGLMRSKLRVLKGLVAEDQFTTQPKIACPSPPWLLLEATLLSLCRGRGQGLNEHLAFLWSGHVS